MLPTTEAAARAALAGAGASKIKIEGTSLREVVKNILGEEMAKLKKVRLTWNPATLPEPPDPSMRIGLLCKWKPYIGPIGHGRYFVQNAMVLESNGQPLKDYNTISTDKKVERLTDGKGNFLREVTYASDRQMVDDALKSYLSIALSLDPNLCAFCARFSTANRNDYLKHVKKTHPEEFDRLLADDDEEAPEPPKKARAQ